MASLKILIADDEPAVLEIMALKLVSAGFDVVSANDGKEAWEKIQSENPDVILLDLNMPHLTGFEVLSHLRNTPPSKKWIPVIIVSAQGEMESLQKGFELQADHYLVKPCRIEDIIKAIRLMIALIPLRNL
ncbi:MAG: response regulator [Candidatus Omnitrophica bacterium]|nr:response regulator [Candidatus Omnitrophota bacterium]